jgi:membrane protease YdiL (CAAX protease family)
MRVTAARAGIAFELGLGGVAVVLAALLGVPALGLIRMSGAAAAAGLIAVIPLAGTLYALRRASFSPIRRIEEALDRTLRPLLQRASQLELLALSLAAAVGEELLFRAVIQGAAGRALGSAAGVAVASAVFGAAHAVTGAYAIIAAVVGAYLGGILLMTGNLLAPIVTHAAYDWIALVYWLRLKSG